MDKAALRQRGREVREGLGAPRRAEASRAIRAALLEWMTPFNPRSVGLYAEFGTEPAITALFDPLRKSGVEIAFPRVIQDLPEKMKFIVLEGMDELVPGYRGLREPSPMGHLCIPHVILLPGLAFDREGGRLGYGGGMYDAYLRHSSSLPLRIGVCFEDAIVGKVPMSDWDIPVDALVSEEGLRWLRDVPPKER